MDSALESYRDADTTRSPFLAGAEAGTVALTAGRWELAIDELSAAADAVDDVEGRALVSPRTLGELLVSWTITEGAKPYIGEGYERVQVHVGLAIAYLALGELEEARVEVRRANALLETEETLYEKEYAAGGVGHFVSAATYEVAGLFDEAVIDYRRMVAKGVGTEIAQEAIVRLTERMDDHEPREEPLEANVVVIAAVGLGPYKSETSITVPTLEGGLVRWAIPRFAVRPQAVHGLELKVEGSGRSVRTEVVEDVGRVAKENLEDRIAWLAAKSAVRATLKYGLAREIEDRWKGWGWIFGTIFALVTERADLRCWQTLPDSWQAARLPVEAGRHRLVVSAEGGDSVDLGTYDLEPGETMFVFARTIERRLFAFSVGGLAVRGVDPGSN